jgi:cytochrome c553
MKKILKRTGIFLGGLIVLILLACLILYPIGMKKLKRTYPNVPVESVSVPTDSGAVARGRHIAIIWACTKCHGDNLAGTLMTHDPLGGNFSTLGDIPATNLTSGKGGISQSYSNIDWIRAIRHGLRPNGQVEIFMYNYSSLSDRDLGDLIAYLKQIPPVDSDFPKKKYGPLIPIAPAIGMFTPVAERIDHSAPRPADPVPGVTIEYGKYISTLCVQCHGNNFSKGMKKWKQEDFIRSFQTGILPNGKQFGSTMSSETFREMNDMELSALWTYLRNK